ncbi:MAG TPA: hypothetical protein ENI87_06620 [bacterium]|nr:hypothetical protein [bacterium]
MLFERYIGRTFHLSADRTFAREEDGGAFTLRRVGSGVAVFEDEGTRVFVPLERLAVRVLR